MKCSAKISVSVIKDNLIKPILLIPPNYLIWGTDFPNQKVILNRMGIKTSDLRLNHRLLDHYLMTN
jgi:hypothetical protein